MVVVTEVKNQNKLLFIFKRKESELKPKMVDVDLPLMLSLSPEPDSPVPITLSAKSTTKDSLFNEVSFFLSLFSLGCYASLLVIFLPGLYIK